MSRAADRWPKISSNLQKQLLPVHPQQNQPIQKQNRRTLKEWLQALSGECEEIRAQMDAQAAAQEFSEKMSDAVGRNGIRSDYNQRKRPLPVTLHLDKPCECRQKQEANSSAKNRPGRRPDPLYDRANVRIMQCESKRDSDYARQRESLERKFGLRLAEPNSGDQPQDHGA